MSRDDPVEAGATEAEMKKTIEGIRECISTLQEGKNQETAKPNPLPLPEGTPLDALAKVTNLETCEADGRIDVEVTITNDRELPIRAIVIHSNGVPLRRAPYPRHHRRGTKSLLEAPCPIIPAAGSST